MTEDSENLTQLMRAASSGDKKATDELYAVVYDQLRLIAGRQRSKWTGNYTMNATALVNEVYIKMAGSGGAEVKDRGHFFCVAARAMRQVLINYAQSKGAGKRNFGKENLQLEEELVGLPATVGPELLDLDAAMQRLSLENQRLVDVIELRYFAGLTVPETAQALQTSPATVKRDTQLAIAWLSRELGSGAGQRTT